MITDCTRWTLGAKSVGDFHFLTGLPSQLPATEHPISFHRPPPSRQCRRMPDNHRYHYIRNKLIRVRIR